MLLGKSVIIHHVTRAFVANNKSMESPFWFSAGFVDKKNAEKVFERLKKNNYIFTVVLRGRGALIDKKNNQKYELINGNFFQIMPDDNQYFEIVRDKKWCEFYISIPKYLYSMLSIFTNSGNQELVGNISITNSLIVLFQDYLSLIENTSSENSHLLLSNVCTLLTKCSELSKKNRKFLAINTNLKNYLIENYQQDVDLEHYALNQGYSYDYLCRQFKDKYGMSPKKFLIDYRMDKSLELFRNVDKSVKDIAHELGYENLNKFVNHFKNYYSVSPFKYRKFMVVFE